MGEWHPLLVQQLNACLDGKAINYINRGPHGLQQGFVGFLGTISRSYFSTDKHYQTIKQIQKLCQAQQDRHRVFEIITNESKDIMTLCNLQGQPLFNSSSVKTELGYETDEFLADPSFERAIHPDDIITVRQAKKTLLETREPQLFSYRIKKLNKLSRSEKLEDNYIWLETSASLVWEDQHSKMQPLAQFLVFVSRIIPINTFMGKLRTDEARLRMTERALRQIRESLDTHLYQRAASPRNQAEWTNYLDNLRKHSSLVNFLESDHSEIIEIFDNNSNYIYVSPSCKTLLGHTPEELLGTNDVETIHPEDVKFMLSPSPSDQIIADIIPTQQFRRRLKNGKYIWLQRIGFIHRDDNSRILHIFISRLAAPSSKGEGSSSSSQSPASASCNGVPRDSKTYASSNLLVSLGSSAFFFVGRPSTHISGTGEETGLIIYASPAALDAFGCVRSQLVGSNILSLCPSSHRRQLQQMLESSAPHSSSTFICPLIASACSSAATQYQWRLDISIVSPDEIVVIIYRMENEEV